MEEVDQQTSQPFTYTTLKNEGIKTGPLADADFSKITTDDRFGSGPLIIFVTPRVDELAKPLSEERRPDTWQKQREQLEKDFCIDKFFLTESAYESNGFFRFHSSEKDAWGCRLLIKELGEVPHKKLLNSISVNLYKCIVGSTFDPNKQTSDIVAVEVSDRPKVVAELIDAIEFSKSASKSDKTKAPASIKDLLYSIFITYKEDTAMKADKVLRQKFDTIQKWAETAKGQWLNSLSLRWRLRLYRVILDFILFDLHKDHCVLEKTVSVADTVRQGKSSPSNTQAQNQETASRSTMKSGLLRTFTAPPSLSQIPQGQLIRGHQITQPKNQDNIELGDPVPSTPIEDQMSTNDKALANHLSIKHTYHWLFLSFWAITLRTGDSSQPVLLCFDDAQSRRFKDLIKVQLLSESVNPRRSLSTLSLLLEEILHMSDEALWGFRRPVRDFEKRRQEHLLEKDDDGQSGYQIHFEIHELSRHLIHAQETLAAAQTAIEAMKDVINPGDTQLSSTLDLVKFSLTFIKNLKLRAGAFVERIENETALAFDIMNFKQLQSTQRLLQESRTDGRDFTIVLAIVSIIFLPGTYFSGLFGLDYFGAGRATLWWWLGLTLSFTIALGMGLVWRSRIKRGLFRLVSQR